MQKYKNREEVPEKYKWNLTDFFKDEKDFQTNYKKCVKMVDELKNYKGCTKDSNKLLEYLEKEMEAYDITEDLYGYSCLISDEVIGVKENVERLGKCENLINNFEVNNSFFESELLQLSKKEYDNLFKNKGLLRYKVLLDKIYRDKDHILDEKSEQIISELNSAMNHFSEMSSTMLNSEHDYGTINIDGEEEKIATTNYRRLTKNKDVLVRKEVYNKFHKVLDRYGISSAQFLNSYVKANNTIAKLHAFKNAWEAKTFYLNMPDKAYETLVNTVESNVDVLQKYFKTFKDTLNLKELHTYDLNLDLAKSKKEYSIEEAQELCLKAIEPLGEDYHKRFQKIIDNRYVDYAQYPKKCSGGYSLATLSKDSRILMSFNYDLDSVSTLIHEGGHNVHHQYVSEYNNIEYRSVSNLVAEVASLTNECLLSSYLADNASTKEEKLAGISNILTVIISNLYGAVREGKIEQEFNKYVSDGNTITKEYMNEINKKSLELYYGGTLKFEEYSDESWIRRSHYYMNYYLYNYAFCISIASDVASKILNGDKKMLDNYIKFLSTGSDVWPIDSFKTLGIDITKKDVYENAIKYFNKMIDEFIRISKEGE